MRRPDDFLYVMLVGPSGTGKSTLANRLLGEFQDMVPSVSYTTRAPRPNELEGREYHFVDRATFREMIERREFLEWAEVHGNLYGTASARVAAARAAHRGMVFDIDYQGARQIRAEMPDVIGVFVLPPSMAELERRLRARGTETDEVVARRLRKATLEVENYGLFDYIVVNDAIDRAYDELRAVVIAERARRWRRAPLAESVLGRGVATPQTT